MTWGYFYCPYCRANRKSDSDLWSYDGDTMEWCCSKSECQAEHRERGEREQKIADIEAELARSKAESDRLRQKLAENEKKQNNRTENNSDQNDNNKHPNNCGICEKLINVNETYHQWPGPPTIDICSPCKPRFLLQMTVQEKILKGKNVDVSILDLPTEDKICLEAFQKIVRREAVNINDLTINNKDKENLKQLQQQYPPNQPSSNNPSPITSSNNGNIPKPSGIYKYASNCRSCQNQWQFTQVPPCCPSCRSRQIDVYDNNGFLQILPPENQENISPVNKKNGNNIELYTNY